MRRTVWLLAGVLLCVLMLGSDSPKEYDDTTIVSIDGTWQLIEGEYRGQKTKPRHQEVMTLHDGTYTYQSDNSIYRGTYRIDPVRKPPHLDWVRSNGDRPGKTLLFIYQIDGDTLRTGLMTSVNDRQRPQGFNGPDVFVQTYKRLKK